MNSNARSFRLCLALLASVAGSVTLAYPAAAQTQARLPDGEVTRTAGYSAWLIDPTSRYRHGALGDEIEACGFLVRTPSGRALTYRLPRNAVFEDRRVRLRDLTGDGVPEAVVIKATIDAGASVAIFRIQADRIVLFAEGPAIGRANRWLNLAGIADYDGDGRPDIAYVQTPHLAGIVRVFALRGNRLRETGRKAGYTNHIIGSRNLDMAASQDVDGDGIADLVLPTLNRRALAVLGFSGKRLVEKRRIAMKNRIRRVMRTGGRIVVEFDNGKRRRVRF